MPSSHVSRNALICSTSRVASSSLPSLTSRLRAETCQLRAELDPVRRVDVDHLHLAAQRLALGEAGHDVERVAEDHAVRPVGVVLVEVDQVELAEAVEGLEQGQLGLVLGPGGGVAEVLDQDARIDLLLDVDRRRVGDEVLAVELVLALPDELRVERRVARVTDGDRLLELGRDEVLGVGGREVGALVGVGDRFDLRRQLQSSSCGAASFLLGQAGRPMIGLSAYRFSIASSSSATSWSGLWTST